MLVNALSIYCQKSGARLSNTNDASAIELLNNINDYIVDDYFNYKICTFVCHDYSDLPDIFIVENKADDFLVYERVIDDFCCLSGERNIENNTFIGKKIIVLNSYPTSTDALYIYNIIKNKIPKVSLFFIPLVIFSLLLPFYSNLFNSRLVYSTSLSSILYITFFFVFFVFLEMLLRGGVYKLVERANLDNSIKLNNFLVYILSVTEDKMAPSTCRTIESSATAYWKSTSSAIVDLSLFFVFFICMILMLGQYSLLLLVYYVGFSFFCVYMRFKSYEKTIKSMGLNNDKLMESLSLHENKFQTLFSNFDALRHALFIRNTASEKLTHHLNIHSHHWSEILKLNTFFSMVIMFIACYLAINSGSLPISTIIAVMIVNSRLSSALIASVNSIYNIKINLHQIKSGLGKLMEKIEHRDAEKIHINRIDQLSLENVTIEPHGRATLSSYDAQFNSGDVVTVLGRVGAGKSTLLRSIIGRAGLQHGVIRYNQVNMRNISPLTFQNEVAYYDASFKFFKGSLRFNFNLYGIYSSERILEIINNCCPALVMDSNMLDEIDADALSLSSGEKQKLIITMMLEKKPSLIVLDEPTAFMPGNEGVMFMKNLISRHRDSIFFIATHDASLKQISTESIYISAEKAHKKIFINTPEISG